GEAAEAAQVGGAVGPVDVVVVGERQVAHAQLVQGAQGAQRVVDGVAALGAHQGGDPPLGAGLLQVVGGERAPQVRRVAGDQLGDDVDLLQRGADRRVAGQVGAHVDRPELAA